VEGEQDCIEIFERKLLREKAVDEATIRRLHDDAEREVEQAFDQALDEPMPTAEDIPRHTYAASKVDAVYPEDYTGLPGGE
jgi:2-oxoisovalerate dehydrogenase E1 component alpha subunit